MKTTYTPLKNLVPPGYLLIALVLLLFTNLSTGYFLFQTSERNSALDRALRYHESAWEAQRQDYRQQFDSIQGQLRFEQLQRKDLQEQLEELAEKKQILKTTGHENKARILRLYDLDSLRHEVTRHYRP